MEPIGGSNNMRMLEKSMEFLWAKQAAHLDNISNAETPGYKVKTVTFEERFSQALEAAGSRGSYSVKNIGDAIDDADWTVWEDEESVRMDDNGVDVTEQFVELTRNTYQLQYVLQSINSDLGRLSKAANG